MRHRCGYLLTNGKQANWGMEPSFLLSMSQPALMKPFTESLEVSNIMEPALKFFIMYADFEAGVRATRFAEAMAA
jgi:hypothetical protein